jgi:hypothetical protein
MSLLCFFAHTLERISNFCGQWNVRGKFARVVVRICHNRLGLIGLLACAGCAAGGESRTIGTGVPAGPAIIVAARPLWQDGDGAAVLQVLGRAGGRMSGSSSEFIVRTADGRLISIVQAAEPALYAGQAVTVLGGQQARLIAYR